MFCYDLATATWSRLADMKEVRDKRDILFCVETRICHLRFAGITAPV